MLAPTKLQSDFLPRTRQKRIERLREVKAVTIGVGFRCADGVVLFADTQATKYDVKFYETKLRFLDSPAPQNETERWVLACCYSGNQAMWHRVMQGLAQRLRVTGYIPTLPVVRDRIEQTLETEREKNKAILDRLEMLYAFSISGVCTLLRSQGKLVSEVEEFQCIGVGDSALIRFLRAVFAVHPRFMTVQECLMLGTYMVDKAKKYIDGCGGETEALVVYPLGAIRPVLGEAIKAREAYLSKIETAFSRLTSALVNPLVDAEFAAKQTDEFANEIKSLGKIVEF